MDTSDKKLALGLNLNMLSFQKDSMIKSIESKFFLTMMLGICFLGFQSTSVAVEAEFSNDTVIITVDSTNLQFSPSEVTINEGQTVRFFWSGEFLDHNAIDSNGLFDTGDPESEVDYSFTFDKGTNNTYSFICEPHEALNMVGTIFVNSSNETMPSGTNQTTNEMHATNGSSNLMYGFLAIPTLAVIVFVSRYFK